MSMGEALAWLAAYVAAGYATHYGTLYVTDRLQDLGARFMRAKRRKR